MTSCIKHKKSHESDENGAYQRIDLIRITAKLVNWIVERAETIEISELAGTGFGETSQVSLGRIFIT